MAVADEGIQIDVIAMIDQPGMIYPERVKRQVVAEERDDYRQAADFINRGGYEVLSVQHEYGIFGGEAGCFLLTLLRAVKAPIVTTLHTVLQNPTPPQRAVTVELLQLSERIVVMSRVAIDILEAEYGLSKDRIELIPHGIPDFSKPAGSEIKEALGIKGPMILTFGLLSPDKGIQFVIEAMPEILTHLPGAVYVVLGATHPNVRANAGEVYRSSLVALSDNLAVADSVHFVDRFVSQEELVEFLVEADVYITPYLNPKQITSGTLAYALGAGKAVVSTPYLYAEELLAGGSGVLVPFRSAEAIAHAVVSLHTASGKGEAAAARRSGFGSQMQWPNIGKRYITAFDEAVRQSGASLRELAEPLSLRRPTFGLPNLSTEHLSTLTDDTGIFQHATQAVPNRAHGYCVDDNARALLLTAVLEDLGDLSPEVKALQSRYLSFVHDSLNEDNGRFRNFMSFNRCWLEPHGSDDSHGRTLWALGAIVRRSATAGHRELARDLFKRGASAVYGMWSPRSWAYAVLGSGELLHAYPNDPCARALVEQMAGRLVREYRICRSDDWRWFEDIVSYANARLSQALIVAGQWLCDREILASGLESLAWLMEHQKNGAGEFRPIGSDGFWRRGHLPAAFDQQPLEAWAAVSACIRAAEATGDHAWMIEAEDSFAWFLGRNDLALSLYDTSTGGCRDGLHADRVNENQGAESTISFLCALAELKSAHASPANANAWAASV